MSALVSLESMADELVRKGLPPEYAERVTAELADHRRDIIEELQAAGHSVAAAAEEADRRIGEPRQVVNQLARAYQRRYFCGRWRALTFVVTPMLAVIIAWNVLALAIVPSSLFAINSADRLGYELSLAGQANIKLALGLTAFNAIAPSLLAIAYYRLAIRAGLSNVWAWISIAQVALVVGSIHWFASHESGRAGMSFPFGADAQGNFRFMAYAPSQLLQAAIPLAVLAALVWRQHRRQAAFLDSPGCSATLTT